VARHPALAAKMKGMNAEIVKPQQRIGPVSTTLAKVATDVATGKISTNMLLSMSQVTHSLSEIRSLLFKLFKYKIAKRIDMLTKVCIRFIYT
jgi:hypothetical protein